MGEEEQSDAWVPAQSKRDGRESSPRRRRAALSVGGGKKQSREVGEGDKGHFAISENSRDHSINKQ